MPFPRPRKPKTCETCGKEYMPNAFSQKFCRSCSTRYNPSKSKNSCSACGRHSSTLVDGLCSFCFSDKRKQIVTQREEEKNGSNHCHECGRKVYGNSRNLGVLLKFRLCTMCFYAKNPTPPCPRCGNNNHRTVRLSDQEAPTPNEVVWWCQKCDFCFISEVRI